MGVTHEFVLRVTHTFGLGVTHDQEVRVTHAFDAFGGVTHAGSNRRRP